MARKSARLASRKGNPPPTSSYEDSEGDAFEEFEPDDGLKLKTEQGRKPAKKRAVPKVAPRATTGMNVEPNTESQASEHEETGEKDAANFEDTCEDREDPVNSGGKRTRKPAKERAVAKRALARQKYWQIRRHQHQNLRYLPFATTRPNDYKKARHLETLTYSNL